MAGPRDSTEDRLRPATTGVDILSQTHLDPEITVLNTLHIGTSIMTIFISGSM